MYCVMIARNIFFWQGDSKAVESLQLLVHIIMCLLILMALKSRTRQILFFVLYAINPLILQVVTYPFYHFWTFLPGAIFIFYFLIRNLKLGNWFFLLSLLMVGIFLIRPTVLFII